MTTVPQLAQTLQTVFTTTADAAARATGFVQRRSKLTGAAFVQALVFGWLANPHASIAALAQAAAVVGVAISPQGVDQRFTEAAAAFLEERRGSRAAGRSAAPAQTRRCATCWTSWASTPPSTTRQWTSTGRFMTPPPTA